MSSVGYGHVHPNLTLAVHHGLGLINLNMGALRTHFTLIIVMTILGILMILVHM